MSAVLHWPADEPLADGTAGVNATSDIGERRRAIYVGYDMASLVHCLGVAWREPDDTPGY